MRTWMRFTVSFELWILELNDENQIWKLNSKYDKN